MAASSFSLSGSIARQRFELQRNPQLCARWLREAACLGHYAALIVVGAEETSFSKTDWEIVTREQALIESDAIAWKASEIDAIPGLRSWTEDFNNLFRMLE